MIRALWNVAMGLSGILDITLGVGNLLSTVWADSGGGMDPNGSH